MGCGASASHNAYIEVSDDTVKENPRRLSASSEVPFPSYWTMLPDVEDHRRCVVCDTEDPDEIVNMQALIDSTRLPDSQHRLRIEGLMRVEDSKFWRDYRRTITYISETRLASELYLNNEDHVLAETKSGTLENEPWTLANLPAAWADRLHPDANEVYLFHATDRKAADAIVASDFKTNLSGKANGQVLGRGIYLAESADLSDEYAVRGPSGFFCMLVVRAVLGKVHATTRYSRFRGKKLVKTTFTSKLVRQGKCDSVLGDRSKANNRGVREYCVANSTQLYPEYLVLYSRETPSSTVEPISS